MKRKEIDLFEVEEVKAINKAISETTKDGVIRIAYYDNTGDLKIVPDNEFEEKEESIIGRTIINSTNNDAKVIFQYNDYLESNEGKQYKEKISSLEKGEACKIQNIYQNVEYTIRLSPFRNEDKKSCDVIVRYNGQIIGMAEGISRDDLKLDDKIGGHFLSESNGLSSIRLTVLKELPELRNRHNDIERS